jgi:hypothetical protein
VGRAGETGDEVVAISRADRGAISESDLFRLRRGQLDPNARAALTARAGGLAAPDPPTEGDLVPNGSGWLIGVGGRTRQLYPDLPRLFDRPFLLGYPLVWAAFFAHTLLGRLCWIIGAHVPIAGAFLIPYMRLRRQLRRAHLASGLAEMPAGTLVRVVGTVAPQATVRTLFRGVPAVLFRNRITVADETRGLDFLLDLDGGERVKVVVRRAFLLESPTRTREPPDCGPVSAHSVDRRWVLRSDLFQDPGRDSLARRYESSIGPGDRIEVCGVVCQIRAPDLEGGLLRVPPMRHVLAAGEDLPLLVRRA